MIKKIFFVIPIFFLISGGLILSGCREPIEDNPSLDNPDNPDIIPIPEVPPGTPTIVPLERLDVEWWALRHAENSGEEVKYNQKIIFIGDSITHYWSPGTGSSGIGTVHWNAMNAKYGNRLTNLGFGGDRTEHVIWRLKNGEFPPGINPEYVVLKIGTNNSARGNPPDYIAAGIGEIIKIINERSPQTKILLFSLLPRVDANSTLYNNFTNENYLKKYDGYLNVQYVDIASAYLNTDGSLNTSLFYDTVHINAAGYQIWKDKIVEIIGD